LDETTEAITTSQADPEGLREAETDMPDAQPHQPAGDAATPKPFRFSVPEDVLKDLRQRLARTRWPDETPDGLWAYGTSVDYMRELVAYWRDGFDWRKAEAKLNAYPQFKQSKDDIDLHFLHGVRVRRLHPAFD